MREVVVEVTRRLHEAGVSADFLVEWRLELPDVLTVEDVLVHKIIAWRPKDRDDIASILSTGIHFYREYVEHWTREWGYEDRWREAQGWQ